MQTIKQVLYEQLEQMVNQSLTTAQENIESANASQENDAKSTAGDKHETGRAMLHLEQENNHKQLIKAIALKKSLSSIDVYTTHTKVAIGSLVYTENAQYFISVGLGKLIYENKLYFAISLASPIGQLIAGKRTGDKYVFQGKEITITAIS